MKKKKKKKKKILKNNNFIKLNYFYVYLNIKI